MKWGQNMWHGSRSRADTVQFIDNVVYLTQPEKVRFTFVCKIPLLARALGLCSMQQLGLARTRR